MMDMMDSDDILPSENNFCFSDCNPGHNNNNKRKEQPESETANDLGEVLKSPLDTNSYKVIQLENGIRVLLVSTSKHEVSLGIINSSTNEYQNVSKFNELMNDQDLNPVENNNSNTSTSGSFAECSYKKRIISGAPKGYCTASLSVKVGSLHDPVGTEGLAHFCEHSVFFGSPKDEVEDDKVRTFCSFIHENGGYYNAYTLPEMTTFYFCIKEPSKFNISLRHFSDIIGFPSFPEELITKEINAVDSEFSLHQPRLASAQDHFLRQLANNNNPMHKFFCGNLQTLKHPDIRQRLVNFHGKYYRANNITLVLESFLTIEEMESYAIDYFSSIPRCVSEEIDPWIELENAGLPFENEDFYKLYKAIPNVDRNLIHINWALEKKHWKNLNTKPLKYLAHMICHDDDGGLVNHLKQSGLALYLNAVEHKTNLGTIFTITILLTEKGDKNWKVVARDTFTYLRKLQTQEMLNVQEQLFCQMRQLCLYRFHYNYNFNYIQQPESLRQTFGKVAHRSELLHFANPTQVLVASNLLTRYNAQDIKECLEKFTPKRANIIMWSRLFSKDECNEVEIFYHIKFGREKLTEDTFKFFNESKVTFKVPSPNSYLTNCMKMQINETDPRPATIAYQKQKRAAVIYSPGTDEKPGLLPKALYMFTFKTKFVNPKEREHCTFIKTWSEIIEYQLDPLVNRPTGSLLKLKFSVNELGHCLVDLQGPSEEAAVACTKILKAICSDDVDRQTFHDIRKLCESHCLNENQESAFYAENLKNYIFVEEMRTFVDDLESLHFMYGGFKKFVQRYRESTFIYTLAAGNVSTSQAAIVSSAIENVTSKIKLKIESPQEQDESPQDDRVAFNKLPLGETCLRVRSIARENHSSFVLNVYQFGVCSKTQIIMGQILANYMRVNAFTQLRTNEQLGYIVNVQFENYDGIGALEVSCSTQPDKFTTDYVDERIDNFLSTFYNEYFSNYEKFKEAYEGRLPPTIIEPQGFNDFQTLYKEKLSPEGDDYRKISIQVVGSIEKEESVPKQGMDLQTRVLKRKRRRQNQAGDSSTGYIDYYIPENLSNADKYFIDDIEEFKDNLELF